MIHPFPPGRLRCRGAIPRDRPVRRRANENHRLTRPESDLEARLRSYELAAKMQLSVPGVTDLSGETATTLDAYGVNQEPTADFGKRCLLARWLLEKGVRLVQLFSGGLFGSPRINWDGHENVHENHTQEAADRSTDCRAPARPAATRHAR